MYTLLKRATVLPGLGSLLLLAACASYDSHGQSGLSQYGKVMVDPVTVSLDENWQPVETGSRIEVTAAELERTRDGIAQVFDEAFRDRLASDGVQLVDEAGPGVLRITPKLVDVRLNAPLEMRDLPTDVYVRDVGDFTLKAVFRDSASGEILLELEEREPVRHDLVRRASPVFTRAELGRIFDSWARMIREDVLHAS